MNTMKSPGLSMKNNQRIQAQTESWRKQKQEPTEEAKLSYITISREYGCDGFNLGDALARQLDNLLKPKVPWAVYDKALLEIIQDDHDISANLVQSVCQKIQSAITDDLASIFVGNPTQLKVVRRIAETMQMLAWQGNAIIVGRGAAIITKDVARGLHVRVVAPGDWRIARVMEQEKLSRLQAVKHVKKMDKEREGFVSKYFKAEPLNVYLYDLVLNNAQFNSDQMAAMMVQGMKSRGLV
jgi:cytidylate kinase